VGDGAGRGFGESALRKAAGRFGKQDFIYVAADDIYRCPASESLTYRYTNEEDCKTLRRYWTRLVRRVS
jgi:hypothetical protein